MSNHSFFPVEFLDEFTHGVIGGWAEFLVDYQVVVCSDSN